MSLAGVRARIKGIVDGVAGVGRTHSYFRVVASDAEIASKLKASGKLHVWMVSLSDQNPYHTKRHPANHEQGTYQYKVYGYYAVDDAAASEEVFSDLVEAVIAAFRADKTLGDTVIDSGPAQWSAGGYKTFAGVLCHYAELDLAVREQLEPAA